MPKHALLSASSSDRWIHCPPSARLSETYEDKGSDYAAEGTDAHSLCEYKLKKALGMEADDPTEHLSWFNQEMDDHATGYAAYVLEQVEAAKETCSDPVEPPTASSSQTAPSRSLISNMVWACW